MPKLIARHRVCSCSSRRPASRRTCSGRCPRSRRRVLVVRRPSVRGSTSSSAGSTRSSKSAFGISRLAGPTRTNFRTPICVSPVRLWTRPWTRRQWYVLFFLCLKPEFLKCKKQKLEKYAEVVKNIYVFQKCLLKKI